MKKFFEEFKAFALKGNVMSMAVGVIIGSAFSGVVTSFTENIVQPLIDSIGGTEVGGMIEIGSTGNYINYGAFISAVINFIIMAFVIFMMVKGMNSLMELGKKKEEAAVTTKECPFCKSTIHIDAKKCPNCTSDVE